MLQIGARDTDMLHLKMLHMGRLWPGL